MELTKDKKLFIPGAVHWDKERLHLFLDPQAPHWIAADERGAQIIDWIQQGGPFGEIVHRYASSFGVEAPKAWLHAHDFVQALLHCGFAAVEPLIRTPYLGRAAYARPTGLKEIWLHTNNICNLACSHCLVGSAPWVKDWGLPTERLLRLIDEAADLGVDRFYFTGGEPFMRKDIFTLIRYITEAKASELIILTNGILCRGFSRRAHCRGRDGRLKPERLKLLDHRSY